MPELIIHTFSFYVAKKSISNTANTLSNLIKVISNSNVCSGIIKLLCTVEIQGFF